MLLYETLFTLQPHNDITKDDSDHSDYEEVEPSASVKEKQAASHCVEFSENLRSQMLLSELDEVSKSLSSRTGEIDLSDVPDLEEVDMKEIEREQKVFEKVIGSGEPQNAHSMDLELEGLD